jgi:signal transduction histidine kinase
MKADTEIGTCISKEIQIEKGLMSAQPRTESPAKIPAEINTKLRALAHDLSNSVETILQASYLLAQANLDDNGKKWADLIDKASRECAKINREIRDILKASA